MDSSTYWLAKLSRALADRPARGRTPGVPTHPALPPGISRTIRKGTLRDLSAKVPTKPREAIVESLARPVTRHSNCPLEVRTTVCYSERVGGGMVARTGFGRNMRDGFDSLDG